MSHGIPTQTLTLTIIKPDNSTSTPFASVTSDRRLKSNMNNTFQEFNHNTIRPVIVSPSPVHVVDNKKLSALSDTQINQDTRIPPPAYVVGMGTQIRPQTPEEKLARQRQLGRERQRRYQEKTKPFSELAHLQTINERIREIWLLTYPDTYTSLERDVFDRMISEFVTSTFRSMGPN